VALTAILALSAAGAAVVPAGAATGRASLPERAGATLHVCEYVTKTTGIAAWEWPGGGHRPGNIVATRALIQVAFQSRPWIGTSTFRGQRWIYGAMKIPASAGGTIDVFGWVGRNYLIDQHCHTGFFETSNGKKGSTSRGEKFTSNPSFSTRKYRGQQWVWGKATHARLPGWVGRNYLTRNSCSSGVCHYTIKQSGIHLWILPGGKDGP
jgi:hypothetical protein